MAEDKNSNREIEKLNINKERKEVSDNFINEQFKAPDSVKKHEIPVKIDLEKPGLSEIAVPAESGGQEIKSIQASTPIQDKERQKKIEGLMSKNLEKPYLEMSKDKQLEFKQKGEEIAAKINNLISQSKATLKNVIDLIRTWLMLLPGLNRFFLEQEAKLKADEIMRLQDISNKI